MGNTFSVYRGRGGWNPPRSPGLVRAMLLGSDDAHCLSIQDAQRDHAEVEAPEVFIDLVEANGFAAKDLTDEDRLAGELDFAVLPDLAGGIAIRVLDGCIDG